MPIDSRIALGIQAPKFDNPLDSYAKVSAIQQAQNQNQLAQLTMQQHQTELDQNNALSRLYANAVNPDGTIDRSKVITGAATGGLGAKIPGLQKSFSEQDQATAALDKTKTEAAKQKLEIAGQAFGHVRDNPTPESASAVLDYLGQNSVFTPQQIAQYKAQVAQNPTGIAQMADVAFRSVLSAKDQLSKIETRNTGGSTDTLAIDPVTGKAAVVSSVKNTASPDALVSAKTSRDNNAATIAAENLRAGVTPGGGLDENAERTAQAIASGRLPPPSGMALTNPKNQRILGRVMEINPNYDYTDVTAKKTAATAFTTGAQGNTLRSLSTASDHLDHLGTLVDALNNGNVQLFNKAKNAYETATGSTAPTNFDAIKNIVGQEVVKAIVAAGGSAGEREEAAKTFMNASSPAQLKGAIQQYRIVIDAQKDNLLQQRRAAGLSDSTLPQYAKTPAQSSPSGKVIDFGSLK
ncbi:MAG: hypothetical protein ACTHKB_15750 [Burkholderiaceae bacterium]